MGHKPPKDRPAGGADGKASGRRLRLWSVIWRLGVVGLVLSVFGLIYLDRFVQDRFSAHKWEAPAKVYGASKILRADSEVGFRETVWWLDALGYRPVAGISGPGDYRYSGNTMDVFRRGFPGPNGDVGPQQARLQFRNDRLVRVETPSGDALSELVLEPPMMGTIATRFAEDRVLVRLEEVPATMLAGLLAVEDRQFFDHHGVSITAIGRAIWANLLAGGVSQGGSTLTQQLVKNLFLSPDQTLIRKGLEAVMAVLLELRVSKEEILEAYVNEVFVAQDGGRAIHGFGLAARHFYGRPVDELSLAQQAMLIGLLRGPSYYSPTRRPERALGRRNLVLRVMRDRNVISPSAYATARREGLRLNQGAGEGPYVHALDLVRRQVRVWLPDQDLRREGLRIYSTLDIRAQHNAQRTVSDQLRQLEQTRGLASGTLQAALVASDRTSGEVRAVVGGRQALQGSYNRALDARRPVGSLLKPVVYLSALESGQHWLSDVSDAEVVVAGRDGSEWRPRNFGRESHGTVPLWEAFAFSYNQAAARTGMQVGLGRVLDRIDSLGYRGDLPAVPSVILGAVDMSPYDVAQMYQPLLAAGNRRPLTSLLAVRSAEGTSIARFSARGQQVIQPDMARALFSGMRLAVTLGTGRRALERLPDNLTPAGKTGTSDSQRDSWFAGSAGDHMAVVWVGEDENLELPLTGSTGALPIWADWMASIARPDPEASVVPGAEQQWVSWSSPEAPDYHRGDCRTHRVLVPVRALAGLDLPACGGWRERIAPDPSNSEGSILPRWLRGFF